MGVSAANGSLPDYENPPVIETVLGVQFNQLANFSNAHLGAFWKALDAIDWPTVVDAPPLPIQYEAFDDAALWTRAGIRISQDAACRLKVTNAASDRMIQIQNSRLHLNWLGKGGGPYPRYTSTLREFKAILTRFSRFLSDEAIGEFHPNQWEITYVNEIPKDSIWTTPADWKFFKPLGGLPTIEGVIEGESFDGRWHFVLPEKRGRLHAEWQFGKDFSEGKESGGQVSVRLTLTARGPIGESDQWADSVFAGLDLGHATIVRTFKELMTDEANLFWGLKHGNSNS
jgi:uncharacterized protein (TIGR04255 family)